MQDKSAFGKYSPIAQGYYWYVKNFASKAWLKKEGKKGIIT